MATPADSTVTVSQKVLQDMLDKAMARGGAGASPAAQPKTFAKNGVGRGSRADIQKKYRLKSMEATALKHENNALKTFVKNVKTTIAKQSEIMEARLAEEQAAAAAAAAAATSDPTEEDEDEDEDEDACAVVKPKPSRKSPPLKKARHTITPVEAEAEAEEEEEVE